MPDQKPSPEELRRQIEQAVEEARQKQQQQQKQQNAETYKAGQGAKR